MIPPTDTDEENNNAEEQSRPPMMTMMNDDDDDDDSASLASSTTSSISPLLNAEQEISRILANRRNYYGVLNLTPQTTSNASVKKSYHKIARVIHPDKCKHPDASAAMSVVTAANSTLTTPKLKQSYDLYYNTQDVSENAKSGSNFDEWHSKSGAAVAGLPPWLVKALSTPVLGAFVMLLMILFGLIFGAVLIVLFLAYMCVHMVFWVLCCCGCGGHCWPRYGEGARIHEIRQRRFFAMLRDYEQAQMFAAQRGETDPDPSAFFQRWNALHPEDLSFPDGYDREFSGKGSSSSNGGYGATDDYGSYV